MTVKYFFRCFLFLAFISLSNASSFQSSESIEAAIEQYVLSKLSVMEDYTVKIKPIDRRLQFSSCSQPLDTFTRADTIKAGRNSIGVRCGGDQKWTLYASVLIKVYKNVITLSQPMRRGGVIEERFLMLKRRDVTTLRAGYFTDKKLLLNQQVTRNLGVGVVINQANIKQQTLVKRGESVQIKVGRQNLQISMAGVALMDGALGQQIRVKNTASKKIIQATVARAGLVFIRF
ncbi:MAG: flagellar basal body P-ring formation protein FlgA [Methylococcales bacterium]|nr:flagellar basal body P-ring formation protein FlgA [Methylococcales bacterium]